MTTHVRVSGTWRDVLVTGLHARVSGTWRQIQQGWVNVSGTWRQFHQAALFALPADCVDNELDPNPATAQLVFATNGTYTASDSPGGDWITPTSLAPGAYTIRASLNSGTTPSGSALDTDLPLSTQRSWLITRSTVGTTLSNLQLTIKDGNGVTMLTQACAMEATIDP